MDGLTNYQKEKRPWGNFERFTHNEQTTMKIIEIRAGESLSLQAHENRDEFWRILKGSGTIHIGANDMDARENGNFFIPRYVEHRATAGTDGLTILEVSLGNFDEHDEVRLKDKYGRA